LKGYWILWLSLLFGLGAYVAAAAFIPPTIIVQWVTANEINTAGFNVYRSLSANGPFVRLNSQLVPASTDPLSGCKYRYEDRAVTPGQTYYYNVEDVEYSGTSTQHGPIVIMAPSVWDLSNGCTILMALAVGATLMMGRRTYFTRKAASR